MSGDNNNSNNNSSEVMKKTLQEVARLKEQLNVRNLEFITLKNKLRDIENDGKANFSKELESTYRSQIEELNKQNLAAKRELQEHLSHLIHNHEGQLASKTQEFELLENKLKDQTALIESLCRDKNVAQVNQSRANATVQELYRKISESQAENHKLEIEKTKLQKKLEKIIAKNKLANSDKDKFVEAIQKLMDSRAKHKSKISELDNEIDKLNNIIKSKDDEYEALRVEKQNERDSAEQNFNKVLDMLKQAEEKV
jgi:chromosome segregation ATPase